MPTAEAMPAWAQTPCAEEAINTTDEEKGLTWDILLADPDADAERINETTALTEMRQDDTLHLTPAVLDWIRKGLAEDDEEAVFPHLTQCPYCRSVLKDALRLSDAVSQSAKQLLKDAEEWALYDAWGQAASEEAQQELLEQGIGYVYGKEGNIYHRMPDGSDKLLDKES